MIRTADRMGHITEEDSFQNNLLEKIYGSVAGRMLIRPLVTPVVSIAMGKLLDSRLSAAAVKPFIRFNHLDMSDYEKRKYISYNDFFKRKIREGARHIDMEPGHFISPCDCRVSVYPVDEKARLHIKQTEYTIDELLRNPSLGKRYQGGYVWVLRLCVQDYHRYIYPDNAAESGRIRIPGILHTVNPLANDAYPIYKQKQQRVFSFENREFPYRADDGGRGSSCRKNRKPARESICETGRRKREFCFRRLHHCADHRKKCGKAG